MLFKSLDKLIRNALMLIIVLIFTGLTLFLVPESYIPFLGKVFAFALLVEGVIQILDFIGSRKALIHYLRLFLGLLAGFAWGIRSVSRSDLRETFGKERLVDIPDS